MKSLLLFSLFALPISAFAVPITVNVLDEKGAPVEGATVQIIRVDESDETYILATTDARGAARYELGASKFSDDFFGNVAVWKAGNALKGSRLVRLKNGALTVTIGAATAVSGTIMDANGPVEGAVVTLESAYGDGSYLWLGANSPLAQQLGARSDATGRFTLEGVPADAQLGLRIAGESYATQSVQAKSGSEIKVALKPGATLRGKALDMDGAPLANLKVVALRQGERNRESSIEARTDKAGNYRLAGIESGTYNVAFAPAKSAEFVVAAREDIVAVAGEARDLETTRAVAGVVVRGRVVDADSGAGVKGISVAIYGAAQPATSEPVRAFATDKDGYFSARVAPGANNIAVLNTPQDYETPNAKIALDVREGAALPNTIIKLTPAIAFRGRIVDEAGQGVKTQLAVKKQNREWPFNSDENGDFKVYPDFKGDVTIGRLIFIPQDEENASVPLEVVEGAAAILPSKEPIQIVVRRAKVGILSGIVRDETGAPIEGVKLNISVVNGEGLGSSSRWESVLSDAAGVFNFPNIRTDQAVKLRGVEKVGYDLQSGGEISRDGDDWKIQAVAMRARRNQLSGRITLADGKGAAGAQVFAAGNETRADENGAYVLKVLPAGNVQVFVYHSGQFGFRSAQTFGTGDAATATDLKLAPQPLQPTDRELAGEMLARARLLAAQNQKGDLGRLKLSDADPVATLEAAIADPRRAEDLVKTIYYSAGNPDIPTDLLLRAVRTTTDPNWRLYGAMMLFAKRPDWPDDDATRELVVSLARDADAIAADPKPNKWLGAISLVGIAPLIEEFEGAEAGKAAMARGIAWTKTQYPQAGDGNLGGYLSILAAGAESIAATSPPLFAQLIEAIDKSSPAYTRALQQGIVAISKSRGLEAATPFLRQLSAAPNPNEDGPGGGTNYAARQATRQAIEAGGASAPDLALQLARGLGDDNDNLEDESARALAEAAFFQSPAVAAGLWRETLPQLDADRAAQIAVRVAATQPILGAELLELARQRLESSDAVNSWGNSVVATFAFYEAKSDAAAARYRLEKAWQKAAGQTDDFQMRPDLVRAMARVDGERAFEWALLLPADANGEDTRVRALSQAALYIEASERARDKVDFEKWERDSTVFMD